MCRESLCQTSPALAIVHHLLQGTRRIRKPKTTATGKKTPPFTPRCRHPITAAALIEPAKQIAGAGQISSSAATGQHWGGAFCRSAASKEDESRLQRWKSCLG